MGRGLVEDEQLGTQSKYSGEVHQLLLPARKVLGFRVHPRFDSEVVRNLGDAAAYLVWVSADVLQTERQLVPNRVAHDLRVGVLHNIADKLGRFRWAHSGVGVLHELLAEKFQRAGRGADEGQFRLQRAEKRGFTAAR